MGGGDTSVSSPSGSVVNEGDLVLADISDRSAATRSRTASGSRFSKSSNLSDYQQELQNITFESKNEDLQQARTLVREILSGYEKVDGIIQSNREGNAESDISNSNATNNKPNIAIVFRGINLNVLISLRDKCLTISKINVELNPLRHDGIMLDKCKEFANDYLQIFSGMMRSHPEHEELLAAERKKDDEKGTEEEKKHKVYVTKPTLKPKDPPTNEAATSGSDASGCCTIS